MHPKLHCKEFSFQPSRNQPLEETAAKTGVARISRCDCWRQLTLVCVCVYVCEYIAILEGAAVVLLKGDEEGVCV